MLPIIPGHGTQKKDLEAHPLLAETEVEYETTKCHVLKKKKKLKRNKILKSRVHPEGTVWPHQCSAVCNTLLSQNGPEMTLLQHGIM